MKRLAFLAVLVSFAPGWAVGDEAKKAADHGMAGDWQGTLSVTPQINLRITLKVIEGKDGALSGTWGSPDEGLEGHPLASVTMKDGFLAFTTKHGVTYKGKPNAAGTEFAGEWTQRGKKYPLTFRRYDPSKIAKAPPIPKELEGFWEGKLKLNAGIELRLVLRVEKQKDGQLKAALASPDQGANNIPISSIGLKGDALTFESKGHRGEVFGEEDEGRDGVRGPVHPGRAEAAAGAQEDGQAQRGASAPDAEAAVSLSGRVGHLRESGRRRDVGRHADLADGPGSVPGRDPDHGLRGRRIAMRRSSATSRSWSSPMP